MDKTIDEIHHYIDLINEYYDDIYYTKDLISFLKREVRFFGECLNYIDLTKLPLSLDDIEECIEIQKKNLEDDDFLSKSKELRLQIFKDIEKSGSYSDMSIEEEDVFSSFLGYFPAEVETREILIELKVGDILYCHVEPEIVLEILYKNFKDITDKDVSNKKVLQKISIKDILKNPLAFLSSSDFESIKNECDDFSINGEVFAFYNHHHKIEYAFSDNRISYISIEESEKDNPGSRISYIGDVTVLGKNIKEVSALVQKITNQRIERKNDWTYYMKNIEFIFDDDKLKTIFFLNDNATI